MGKAVREEAKEVAAASLWPCGLDYKPWAMGRPGGLIKGNDVIKSVFGEDRPF